MKKKGKEKQMLPMLKIKIERWKFNKEHEVYVSTEGRIKDRYKDNVEIMLNSKTGYPMFFSETQQKFVSVHRTVLKTWRPREDMDSLTVEHKDQNKRNPALSNLMWLIEEENLRRAQQHDLGWKQKTPVGNSNKRICANGVTMTVEDAVTFIFNSSQCDANISKIELRTKVNELLESNKQKKMLYGITFTEVKS